MNKLTAFLRNWMWMILVGTGLVVFLIWIEYYDNQFNKETCQGVHATSACFTLKLKEAQVKEESEVQLQALKEENK